MNTPQRWVGIFAALTASVALAASAQAVQAQTIADAVAALDHGQVRFSFAARDSVCGDGERISTRHRTEDWEGRCDTGPVRVALDVRYGAVADIDTYVGGRWRERPGVVRDLGMIGVTEASDYLLALAERGDGDTAEHAIFPATLADSVVVWPRLLRLAKDEQRPRDVRKAAVLWLSLAAADVAVEELGDLATEPDGDIEVRKMALFGLSQLDDGRGIPVLLEVARTNRDPELRKMAIFWLGQSDDPRAFALIEEILTAKR